MLGTLCNQTYICEQLHKKSLNFVYSMLHSKNTLVSGMAQLALNTARSPTGRNIAYLRHRFHVRLDDNATQNARRIHQGYAIDLDTAMNISIAQELLGMKELPDCVFTNREIDTMLELVCTD